MNSMLEDAVQADFLFEHVRIRFKHLQVLQKFWKNVFVAGASLVVRVEK